MWTGVDAKGRNGMSLPPSLLRFAVFHRSFADPLNDPLSRSRRCGRGRRGAAVDSSARPAPADSSARPEPLAAASGVVASDGAGLRSHHLVGHRFSVRPHPLAALQQVPPQQVPPQQAPSDGSRRGGMRRRARELSMPELPRGSCLCTHSEPRRHDMMNFSNGRAPERAPYHLQLRITAHTAWLVQLTNRAARVCAKQGDTLHTFSCGAGRACLSGCRLLCRHRF